LNYEGNMERIAGKVLKMKPKRKANLF